MIKINHSFFLFILGRLLNGFFINREKEIGGNWFRLPK